MHLHQNLERTGLHSMISWVFFQKNCIPSSSCLESEQHTAIVSNITSTNQQQKQGNDIRPTEQFISSRDWETVNNVSPDIV